MIPKKKYRRFDLTALLFFILLICQSGSAQRLVMPGDHPDPSVVKIGDTYWASATTSNWFPAYPLLKSTDLLNWQQDGYVFDKMPEWTDYYFWAPEISYENGKVYMYYSAHKKNGNLCVGVASADKPEGPYRDHGPLMCQEVGSIDAFPMRDENGKLFIIWKEDGNSVKKPTPIWAMEMNEDRSSLVGEKKELFRNDQPWEGNLVEGVSMIRHGEYYYAFYAARGCCGIGCNYVVGIARSKKLLGPWEKYDKNPLMQNLNQWVCPGHGTPVEKDGRFYFLYHAYNKSSHAFTGREGVLSEFIFNKDGWVEFVNTDTTSNNRSSIAVKDNFNGKLLSDRWQWSVFQNVASEVNKGELHIHGIPSSTGAYLGTKIFADNYNATALIRANKSSSLAGIGLIGDDENAIFALYKDNTLQLSSLKDGKDTTLLVSKVMTKKKLYLRAEVSNNKEVRFLFSRDGKNYITLNDDPVDGSFLPPWDRAVRVGLISKGKTDQKAVFDSFEMTNR
jgi:GH43 family beta-xylosidase